LIISSSILLIVVFKHSAAPRGNAELAEVLSPLHDTDKDSLTLDLDVEHGEQGQISEHDNDAPASAALSATKRKITLAGSPAKNGYNSPASRRA
jgi:hypothetical protein